MHKKAVKKRLKKIIGTTLAFSLCFGSIMPGNLFNHTVQVAKAAEGEEETAGEVAEELEASTVASAASFTCSGASFYVQDGQLSFNKEGGSNKTESSQFTEKNPDLDLRGVFAAASQKDIQISGLCDGFLQNDDYLTSVVIPKEVKTIGAAAFNGCLKLQKVEFEEGSLLTEIKDGAVDPDSDYYFGRNSIEKAEPGNNNTGAFGNLGGGFYKNGEYISCEGLTSINMEVCTKLEKIGAGTFLFSGLEKITIPKSVQTIGDYAFGFQIDKKGHDKIWDINVLSDDAVWSSNCLTFVGGDNFSREAKKYTNIDGDESTYPTYKGTDYTTVLTGSFTNETAKAFCDNSSSYLFRYRGAENIEVTTENEDIPKQTHGKELDLTGVQVQISFQPLADTEENRELIEKIQNEEISGITLKKNTETDNYTPILILDGKEILNQCSVTGYDPDLENSDTSEILTISYGAVSTTVNLSFQSNGAEAEIPVTVEGDANSDGLIYSENGVSFYSWGHKLSFASSNDADSLRENNNFEAFTRQAQGGVIDLRPIFKKAREHGYELDGLYDAFMNSSPDIYSYSHGDNYVKEIIIPYEVETIGAYAFNSCSKLTKVTFADEELTEAEIEEGKKPEKSRLKHIYEQAFLNCSALNTINLEDTSLEEVDERAFAESGVTKITLPDTCRELSATLWNNTDGVFASCKNLREITLSEGINTIPRGTFADCMNLIKVVIPKGVQRVEKEAFSSTEGRKYYIYNPDLELPAGCLGYKDCTIITYDGGSVMNYSRGSENDNIVKIQVFSDSLTQTGANLSVQYYGKELDLTDYSLTAKLTPIVDGQDGGTKILMEGDIWSNCDISGYNPEKAGQQYVTFEYGGVSTKAAVMTVYQLSNDYDSSVEAEIESTVEYHGRNTAPTVKLTNRYTQVKLTEGKDYTLSVSPSSSAGGKGSYVITGMGNYAGVITGTYQIRPLDLEDEDIQITVPADVSYDGKNHVPELILKLTGTQGEVIETLENGTDYTLSTYNEDDEYQDTTQFVNAGKYQIILEGKGNYTGSKTVDYTIRQKKLTEDMLASTIKQKYDYTGSQITPEITMKDGDTVLVSGKDYTVTYGTNLMPGQDAGTVTVEGKNNYNGKLELTFEILSGIDFTKAVVEGIEEEVTYTGSGITFADMVVKIDGKEIAVDDYTAEYKDNVNVGTATLILTGKNQYIGSIQKAFTITQADISIASADAIKDVTYTGEKIEPEISLSYNGKTLKVNSDYTVSYEANIEAGGGIVTVTGAGNFTGKTKIKFQIQPADIKDAFIKVEDGLTYTGEALEPSVTVTFNGKELTEKTDYTLAYSSNVNAGTLKVKITGTGNFSGTVEKTIEIAPIDITDAVVKVEKELTYTGAELKPEVTITIDDTELILDTDYTVDYASNVQPGQATITITGIGNYTGEVKASFTIKPVPTPVPTMVPTVAPVLTPTQNPSTTTAPTATPKATAKATTKTTTSKLAKAKITKVKATGKNVKVTWKKVKNAESYQVQIASNRTFKKNVKTVSVNKLTYTFKKMKKGYWYVRVAAVQTVKEEEKLGTYSIVRKVKVKK